MHVYIAATYILPARRNRAARQTEEDTMSETTILALLVLSAPAFFATLATVWAVGAWRDGQRGVAALFALSAAGIFYIFAEAALAAGVR